MFSFLGFIIASCPHFFFPAHIFFFPSVSALYLWSQYVFINTEFTSVCKNRIDLGDFLGSCEPNDFWNAMLNNAYMMQMTNMIHDYLDELICYYL